MKRTSLLAVFVMAALGAVTLGTAALAFGVNTYITEDGHLAARSKDNVEQAIAYEKTGERKKLDDMLKNRKVFRLKGGDSVYVEGSETGLVDGQLIGLVRIRYEGVLKEVWTSSNAVIKKD